MSVRFRPKAQIIYENMKYLAVVEIPKGSNRRIHMSYDNTGFIDLGPIKDQIPVNDGVMPVCYGYIDKTINKQEKDNVDAIIFSNKSYDTGDTVLVEIIGMLTRDDGDHKLITVDDSITINNFSEIDSDEMKLIRQYFGYKSKINSIDSKEKAIKYLQNCMTN